MNSPKAPHSASGTKKTKASSSASQNATEGPLTPSWRTFPSLPILPEIWSHHSPVISPLIEEWRSSGRVPPVLLLTGPSGIGKNQVVHHLSQILFCKKAGFQTALKSEESLFDLFVSPGADPAPEEEPLERSHAPFSSTPCGDCPACIKALSGNWVDFLEIAPDAEDGEKGSLKIEQFRALKEKQGFSGFDGSYFIIHVRDADRMTIAAANSLLKLLEEPPSGWIFFLTAPDPSLVLPTILSRCQRLRLRPLSEESLAALLNRLEIPTERRASCIKEAQGSIERALLLARDEAWSRRTEVAQFLKSPISVFTQLLEWGVHSQDNFDLLLDRLEQELHSQLSQSQSLSREQLEFLIGRFERVTKVRQESLAPLNRKILLQDLLSPWIGAPL